MTLREPPQGKVPLPGEWAERGACRGWPTEWWYPGGEEKGFRTRSHREQAEDAESARRICTQLCPVLAECAVHALRYGEPGIWAGATQEERRKAKRRRKRVA